nr:MAG TPA: hypothetical protein [Crassvirales sp.]DAU16046.1 MAG TPA: hypothetical protein [Caudoviricetes sp.]
MWLISSTYISSTFTSLCFSLSIPRKCSLFLEV